MKTCIAATVCALAMLAPTAAAADTQLLLVHGYGPAAKGKDCNGSTWKNALAYYQDAGGRDRSSMSTVGYYEGDEGCDVIVGDGKATNDRPIQDIARDLANYVHDAYTSKGEPVDIVAHSMGGLITRVALLGSAQAWDGFPSKLHVSNVVTLSTPHQGVANPGAHDDEQWRQMRPGSGFIDRLHEQGSGLGDDWATGTDWSLVGSEEDATVKYESGIDKGSAADQKYGYQDDPRDSGEVDHTGVRTLFGENEYDLTYWHAAGDHPPHHTRNGWSPLKTAFQAATKDGDGLPR
jgi:pimeloyl-ACP methyl ester carboxylesterase